jgi:hypothetical protein
LGLRGAADDEGLVSIEEEFFSFVWSGGDLEDDVHDPLSAMRGLLCGLGGVEGKGSWELDVGGLGGEFIDGA